ncbi:MAG: M20 family peptidase [Candidatus Obscuribacterales bacterium]|nr:M20 family peptidase [Candidatus Obscuribacterales bacterium]
MRVFKTVIVAVLLLALLLVGVLAYRTANYRLPASAENSSLKLVELPEFDSKRAALHLAEAVRIKTISHENPAEDEPQKWLELHEWLQNTYPISHALMQRRILADRSLLFTWKGRNSALKPFILMAHQDVVPVKSGTEKEWTHAPFSGDIKESAVWGRGAIDDKGSLVALFEALESLSRIDFVPERSIYIVCGHDEETVGSGARAVAAYLKSQNVHAEFILDEGMQIISNHPITNSKVALIGIAEKGFGTLKITASTEGGHSSMPPVENAVVFLSRAILSIVSHPYAMHYDGPTAEMLRALAPYSSLPIRIAVANDWLFAPLLVSEIAASPAGRAMLQTTIAPTMLEASPKENVLPASASGWINYRIGPHENSESIMAHSRQALGSLPVKLEWSRKPDEATRISSSSSRAWKILAALALDTAKAPVAPSLFIGGSDSRYLQDLADDTYRFQAITSSLDELKMIHGTNEHLSLKNLEQLTRFYASLIVCAAK